MAVAVSATPFRSYQSLTCLTPSTASPKSRPKTMRYRTSLTVMAHFPNRDFAKALILPHK